MHGAGSPAGPPTCPHPLMPARTAVHEATSPGTPAHAAASRVPTRHCRHTPRRKKCPHALQQWTAGKLPASPLARAHAWCVRPALPPHPHPRVCMEPTMGMHELAKHVHLGWARCVRCTAGVTAASTRATARRRWRGCCQQLLWPGSRHCQARAEPHHAGTHEPAPHRAALPRCHARRSRARPQCCHAAPSACAAGAGHPTHTGWWACSQTHCGHVARTKHACDMSAVCWLRAGLRAGKRVRANTARHAIVALSQARMQATGSSSAGCT
jgi:hypothetical protein